MQLSMVRFPNVRPTLISNLHGIRSPICLAWLKYIEDMHDHRPPPSFPRELSFASSHWFSFFVSFLIMHSSFEWQRFIMPAGSSHLSFSLTTETRQQQFRHCFGHGTQDRLHKNAGDFNPKLGKGAQIRCFYRILQSVARTLHPSKVCWFGGFQWCQIAF